MSDEETIRPYEALTEVPETVAEALPVLTEQLRSAERRASGLIYAKRWHAMEDQLAESERSLRDAEAALATFRDPGSGWALTAIAEAVAPLPDEERAQLLGALVAAVEPMKRGFSMATAAVRAADRLERANAEMGAELSEQDRRHRIEVHTDKNIAQYRERAQRAERELEALREVLSDADES